MNIPVNKKVFTTKDENGNDLELAIKRVSPKIQIESQLIYNKNWSLAQRAGSPLRRNLDSVAEQNGLWGPEQRTQVAALEAEIIESERKLRAGSTYYKTREEAKVVALHTIQLRRERMDLLLARNSLDAVTAESFADDARLQYLTAVCTVRNADGVPYFKDYDDYISKSNTQVAMDALSNYFLLVFGDRPDERASQYEYEWLIKNKFMNAEYHLIDSQGRLVTEDGKLVDKDGRYIREDGSFCDNSNVPVDKDGNYLIEYKEFDGETHLDDMPEFPPENAEQ
jgi:hypothetical protein